MKYKTYSKYKDSGIEWIGKVPEGWDVGKLAHISKLYSGGTPDKTKEEYWENGEIPWISSGEVNQVEITHPTTLISKEGFHNSSAKWMPEDALIMALAGQGKTKGMVAYLKIRTTGNQSLAAIIPEKINSRYLFYWLRSKYLDIRGMAGEGIRDGLDLDMLKEIKTPLPFSQEQKSIASFLDKKTAEIDSLVEKDRRLIDLLREKRASLINHAVTKGLDSKAEMKDSGVEWIGEIPESADVLPFRRICNLNQGLQYPQDDRLEEPVEHAKKYITIKYIHSEDKVEEYIPNPPRGVVCKKTDVLLARTGATGEVVTNQEGVFHNNFFRINYNSKVYRDYLVYYLRHDAVKKLLLLKAGTTTIPDLDHGQFLDTPFLLHLFKEQVAITEYLDAQTSRIDQTFSKIESKIALLQEYKKSLIHHAVTGQIDIRS